ncbi:MAG: hypothetical protein KIS88_05575 [Anaerolineales bacterium]|nr:hypothetical protein [Anaerolineales bacterium]
MQSRTFLFSCLLILAIVLTACGGQSSDAAIATGIAQTLQVSQLETAAAANNDAQPTPAVENTPQPENTEEAVPEIALVSVSTDTNCRSGPSQHYKLITTVTVGQQVEVLKTFADSDYVVVQNPNGAGDCWLWLRYADTTDFTAYDLPTATQPPTPTPTITPSPTPSYDWSGNWTIRVFHGGVERTGAMSCSVTGMSVTCSAVTNPGAFAYSFTGTIAPGHQDASGTFGGTGSGNWQARITAPGSATFIGNLDMGSWEFCGVRSGAFPSPCKWP